MWVTTLYLATDVLEHALGFCLGPPLHLLLPLQRLGTLLLQGHEHAGLVGCQAQRVRVHAAAAV